MELKLDQKKVLNKEKILQFADYIRRELFKDIIKDECLSCKEEAKRIFKEEIGLDAEEFFNKLPEIKKQLTGDLKFFFDSDPAANCYEEIVVTYPGYTAIIYYRIAHIIYEMGNKVAARIIGEHAHFLTGIDINPGAKINSPFFIDHGTGIVVGETTIIGKNVKIYQGVTLGALSLSKGHELKEIKRHPTVGNNVTIYSGASILGNINIGDNVVIGSNVFLTESIESNHRVSLAKPDLIVNKK